MTMNSLLLWSFEYNKLHKLLLKNGIFNEPVVVYLLRSNGKSKLRKRRNRQRKRTQRQFIATSASYSCKIIILYNMHSERYKMSPNEWACISGTRRKRMYTSIYFHNVGCSISCAIFVGARSRKTSALHAYFNWTCVGNYCTQHLTRW